MIGIENDKFDITFIARYAGQTRTKSGQNTIVIPEQSVNYNNVNTIDQFIVVDASVNWKINKYLTIFGTVNNMLNSKYIVANQPQGYLAGMPLFASIGLKVRF